MGGFLGIGGAASKTDRSNQLTSYSDLKNVFNWSMPTAQAATSAGVAQLGQAGESAGQAGNYFQKLMSGNRAAVAGAAAPAVDAVQQQSDAGKRQLEASGTARGGGVAGVQQQGKDAAMSKIQNLRFGAQKEGAVGTLEAAKTEGGVGAAEGSIGANLASTSTSSAANLGQLAGDSRKTSLAQENAQGAAIGQLAMTLLFG